jgi:hypothetical protein
MRNPKYSTFKLIEKHRDSSSLLALIKVSVLIKDTSGVSDVFCEARELRVTEYNNLAL